MPVQTPEHLLAQSQDKKTEQDAAEADAWNMVPRRKELGCETSQRPVNRDGAETAESLCSRTRACCGKKWHGGQVKSSS